MNVKFFYMEILYMKYFAGRFKKITKFPNYYKSPQVCIVIICILKQE